MALLQLIGASGVKTVQAGNSAQVSLGTPVLAIGNVEGRGGLPATAPGIINSLDRTITPTDEGTGTTETLYGMLQTSARIDPGDSGGPLANAASPVIPLNPRRPLAQRARGWQLSADVQAVPRYRWLTGQ